MSWAGLESFWAYQKARELFDSYYPERSSVSVQAEQTDVFCRPFGTWGSHCNGVPGLKAWAIVYCPSGTGQKEIRRGAYQKKRHLAARLARILNHLNAVRAGRNPFRVVDTQRLNPRVASQARQPWALRRNPFGILYLRRFIVRWMRYTKGSFHD
jgi:hypothetical protein